HGLHQRGHLRPAGGLPDAVFLLAHGGPLGPLPCVFQQLPGEGALHAVSPWLARCPARDKGPLMQRMVDLSLTLCCRSDDNLGSTLLGLSPCSPPVAVPSASAPAAPPMPSSRASRG